MSGRVRAVVFFGLSGTGKSTLMQALAAAHPDQFVVPPRFTTRAPKVGDQPGEVVHVSAAELREQEQGGELLLVMAQNSNDPATSFTAYAKAALETARIPLLFASVFNAAEMRSLDGALLVHVRADWRAGLLRRGGDTAVARTRLNEALAREFGAELDALVDVVFEHAFQDAGRDAQRLFAALCVAAAKRGQGELLKRPSPLLELAPYATSANVRRFSEAAHVVVTPGVGSPGDVVFGEVVGSQTQPVFVREPNGGELHEYRGTPRVLAVLGARESTTHVNGGVPVDGLTVGESATPDAAWLAGESGIVGQLWLNPSEANAAAERSVQFRTLGVVRFAPGHGKAGLSVTLQHLALHAGASELSTPILALAATSAEAGKTTLAEKLIRGLVAAGKRVAAIKITGTGGVVDSNRHRAAGAHFVADQVDAGLASTYVTPSVFASRALVPFLAAQAAGVDVIVAELGGDLPGANNPTLLRLPAFARNVAHLWVIVNDALAALGAHLWLRAEAASIESSRITLVASPFRNLQGLRRREAALELPGLADPNDVETLTRVAREALAQRVEPRPPQVIDVSAGRSDVLEEFWRQHGDLRSATFTPAAQRMGYELDDAATAIGAPVGANLALEASLRAVHSRAKNAIIDTHELVLGVGARQLVLAALYALRRQAEGPLELTSAIPVYPFVARIGRVNPELARWNGPALPWTGGLREPPEAVGRRGPQVAVITAPSNPTGEWSPASPPTATVIYDCSYGWPHLAPDDAKPIVPRAEAVMIFSLSKLTGHAGSRLGWAWVRERALAQRMREYIRHHTIGVSVDAQLRAQRLVDSLLRDGGARLDALFAYVPEVLAARWPRVEAAVARARLELVGPRRGWCYALLRDDGGLAERLLAVGVRGYDGAAMAAPGFVRLNLLSAEREFSELLSRLGSLKAQT